MVSRCSTGLWSPPPVLTGPEPWWGEGASLSLMVSCSRSWLGKGVAVFPLPLPQSSVERAGGWLGTAVPVLTLAVWRDAVSSGATNAFRGRTSRRAAVCSPAHTAHLIVQMLPGSWQQPGAGSGAWDGTPRLCLVGCVTLLEQTLSCSVKQGPRLIAGANVHWLFL